MSAVARNQVFSAVHTVGGLLPVDILARITEGKDVSGCGPADYRVVGARSVRDEAERHWDYLRAAWSELRRELPATSEADVPADPTGIALTQWLMPLFTELGFGELATVGEAGLAADDQDKSFRISHRWNHVPIHIAAWDAALDRPSAGAGGTRPQSLVQECLNRRESDLWGVLTNGRRLRLLRDSNALSSSSYVEFDLEAIFDGELFSEFVLLYRLLHVTRFTLADGAAPTTCWLERWRAEAIASGTRALDALRDAVQQAVTTLGTGFLRHPQNVGLRDTLDVHAFHTALLRLTYRMIFLFVAEDRDALHPPETGELARQRYADYFSAARLRRHASRHRGTTHSDLYQALRIVLDSLGDEHGCPELGLPGLGGLFDDTGTDSYLDGLSLSNSALLTAVRHLSRIRDGARWRAVDYRNMGAEELGSVYESLLESVPKHSAAEMSFELTHRLGNQRKRTGSYFTPASLIETLLNSSLDPVIDEAQKRGEQRASTADAPDPTEHIAAELRTLTVCDPACGSGHFLVAAARRIAKRLAAVREGNPEPTREAMRHALHEVIACCVYGVDNNPMAVELAKVSLWLEALEPGKPLSFLDAHIKFGNGLIGATPALLRNGIPTRAFKPVEGDDPAYAKAYAEQNDAERSGQGSLFEMTTVANVTNTGLGRQLREITDAPADTLAQVRAQATAYREWENSAAYRDARHVADAWCAAFMWYQAADGAPPPTESVFRTLQSDDSSAVPRATQDEIVRLRQQYGFFHWHLAFPDVFTVPQGGAAVDPNTGWAGGFSCVLANPPWDKVDFEDKKYFGVVEPDIAAVSGAARKRAIAEWERDNPAGAQWYHAARRAVKSTFHFAGSSGAFPLCGQGLSIPGVNSLQTDQLFTERFATIAAPTGRTGCVIPTAIATGAGAQYLFGSFTQRGAVTVLYDFENRQPLFLGVDSRYKFCLLSLVGTELREPSARFAFFMADPSELEQPERVFALTPDEIALINPNTGNLPVFRGRRDANLTAAIYQRLPVLRDESTTSGSRWQITFKNLFNMTDDSDLFRTREALEAAGWELDGNVFVRDSKRMLPLYEGKMVHHFDHRWNSYYGTGDDDRRHLTLPEKQDPAATAMPRYWIAESGTIRTVRKNREVDVPGVAKRLTAQEWDRVWLIGWRDVCRSTDERTATPAIIPRTAVGHTMPLMLVWNSAPLVAGLVAAQSSLVFDFVARQKIGGTHMALMTWKQLPVPSPAMVETHLPFLTGRVLELVYTTRDMAGFAADLDDSGPPFQWDEQRRAQLRAELDAYFFHLYGIGRDDADYILDTFQSDAGGGLKNNEIAEHGTYRTKNLVLAEHDRMASTGLDLTTPLIDGEDYTSPLTPPPGHGHRHPQ